MVKIQVDSLGKAIMLNNKALKTTGGEAEDFLVQVIDYDGTILKSARLNEGATFTLPDAPTHTGLVFDGWSSPVTITNNTVTVVDQDITIGPMFHTSSGLSEFDITLTEVTGLNVTLNMNGTKNWGDGTSDTLTTHTYASTGDYTITCNGSTMTTSSSSGLFGQSSSIRNSYITHIRLSNISGIGSYAFQWCLSLSTVTIPIQVNSIGVYTFESCSSLVSLTIPKNVTFVNNYTFNACYSLISAVIPYGTTGIGAYAFANCYSLSSITIPTSATNLGSQLFYNCLSLKSITIPVGVTSLNTQIFTSCSTLRRIIIPDSIRIIGTQAFAGTKISEISIPKGVTTISNSAFASCDMLSNINIPEGVTSIGSQIFISCRSLSNVKLPSSLSSIGYSAFNGCNSLTELSIPLGVQSIEKTTFQNCRAFAEISIPESVVSIGESAFESCTSLKRIIIPSSVSTISARAFIFCSSIKEYDFREHTTVPLLANVDAFQSHNAIFKILVPWDLYQEWITTTNWSTYADYIYGGTPATLNFTVTPNNSLIFVNGSQIQGTSTSWVGSVAPYIVYDSTNNVVLSSQQTGITEGSTANIAVDLTNSNKITLSTGVTGLSAIVTKDGLTLPMIEESSGNYSVNVVGSGTIVDYYINGGSNYMDASGSITATGSDITEVITLTPAVESTFVRPDLTADGTLGGDSFAVKDIGADTYPYTYAWEAVDNSATTYWNGNTPYSGDKTYVFYNPDALKVSELTYIYSSTMYRATAVTIEGSNDNSTWESITSSYSGSSTTYTSTLTNSKSYKYYKLTFTPYSSYVRIYDLAITATYKAPAS